MPPKSPAPPAQPQAQEAPPPWAAAFMLQMERALGEQGAEIRAEAAARQVQIDAALASVLAPQRPTTPPRVSTESLAVTTLLKRSDTLTQAASDTPKLR